MLRNDLQFIDYSIDNIYAIKYGSFLRKTFLFLEFGE